MRSNSLGVRGGLGFSAVLAARRPLCFGRGRLRDQFGAFRRLRPPSYGPLYFGGLSRSLAELEYDLNPQGTPGLSELKMLLDLRRGLVTDSALEVKVIRRLRAVGLATCVEQFSVYENGKFVMRLDFAWPARMVAIHADGYRWHNQRERFDRDARQRSWLQKLGWRFITVTNTTLTEGAWLEELRF